MLFLSFISPLDSNFLIYVVLKLEVIDNLVSLLSFTCLFVLFKSTLISLLQLPLYLLSPIPPNLPLHFTLLFLTLLSATSIALLQILHLTNKYFLCNSFLSNSTSSFLVLGLIIKNAIIRLSRLLSLGILSSNSSAYLNLEVLVLVNEP